MTTGELICMYRKKLGLTQEELAQLMGYSHKASINKIEKGRADIPKDKLFLFAKHLKVKPEALLGDQPTDHGVWDGITIPPEEFTKEKVIDDAGLWFGKKAASILISFNHLNDAGQEKAVEFVEDLTSIEKYRKEGE